MSDEVNTTSLVPTDEVSELFESEAVHDGTGLADNSSLGLHLKRYLDSDDSNDDYSVATYEDEGNTDYKSIYDIAHKYGMSLQEFVNSNPKQAVQIAESILAAWNNILTQAAIQGGITINVNGREALTQVNKNQVRMIEVAVNNAKDQLNEVKKMSFNATRRGETHRDRMLRVMYNKAIHGDGRMAMFMYDKANDQANAIGTTYDYAVYCIIQTLFKKQLEVLNAGTGAMLICCSRRAGKTHLLVALLLIECLRNPGVICIYIGETAELSEQLIDTAANEIIRTCHLKDTHGNVLNWRKLDNGSRIMVRGLSNTKDPDQIRGNKSKVIVIDEFFHLKSELLEYLQREVLEPMQLDYADSYKFICAGTPPQIKGTYGEHVWNTWDVPHFKWTWKDNPHPVDVAKRAEYVERILAEKGLDWTSSYARREYLGEWAYDDDLLLYPEYHTYDPAERIPDAKPSRILFGIDYGVGDNDTLIGVVRDDDKKFGYEFYEAKFNRLDIKDISVSQLEYLCGKVKEAWLTALEFFKDLPAKEANKRILWDADDNDQHVTDYININVRFTERDNVPEEYYDLRINIQNAHKVDRVLMMDKIRDELRLGNLLVIKGGKLEQEINSTILKRGPNGEVYNEVDMRAYHPDLLPALRYLYFNILGV